MFDTHLLTDCVTCILIFTCQEPWLHEVTAAGVHVDTCWQVVLHLSPLWHAAWNEAQDLQSAPLTRRFTGFYGFQNPASQSSIPPFWLEGKLSYAEALRVIETSPQSPAVLTGQHQHRSVSYGAAGCYQSAASTAWRERKRPSAAALTVFT